MYDATGPDRGYNNGEGKFKHMYIFVFQMLALPTSKMLLLYTENI